MMPPNTTSMKIRVCNRPFRVGNIRGLLGRSAEQSSWRAGGSRLAPEQPLPPLDRRADRADPLAELPLGEVLVDLLGRDLQSEEGVDAREVPTQGGRARGIHRAVAVAGADQLEVAVDVEPAG